MHQHVQTELSDDFLQPRHPPGHRLQQHDPEIRTGDRQRYSRQARAGAHIECPSALRYEFPQHRGIEQVPFPQPVCFPGTDDTPGNPRSCEQLGVPLSEFISITEQLLSRGSTVSCARRSGFSWMSGPSSGHRMSRRIGSSRFIR
jgi:hypothetical protein